MYDTRGQAYLYAGVLTKALADFDKASELNPKTPMRRLILAHKGNFGSCVSAPGDRQGVGGASPPR
jgi:hypothetical protein